jgi:hypothetical protein
VLTDASPPGQGPVLAVATTLYVETPTRLMQCDIRAMSDRREQ